MRDRARNTPYAAKCAFAASLVALGACATVAPPQPVEIAIPGKRVFPESITATRDGVLIIGAAGSGAIYRAAPGESTASVWIDPGRSGLVAMLGVFADDASNRLFVCSRPARGASGPRADAASSVRVFALDTGAPVASYPMPGGAGALCNDFAVDAAGAAFVAETIGGRILRLAPDADRLEVWAHDDRLRGVDGIAIAEDGALIVNTVMSSRLYRIAREDDGASGAITELTPTFALSHPDGLRTVGDGRFVMAESGAGRVSVFTIEGDRAVMRALGGKAGTTAVAVARGVVWAADAKYAYLRDPALADADPGAFSVYALPLD